MAQIHKENIDTNNDNKISVKDVLLKVKEWLTYLRSKGLIIFIVGFLGASLGFAYAFLKKPVYQAKLSFALDDEKSGGGLGMAAGLASQFGIDLGGGGGGAFSGDNLLELMKSRSIVESTLLKPVVLNNKSQTLAECYITFNKLRKTWEENPKLKNIEFLPNPDRSKFSLQQDSVLGTIYNAIIKNNLSVDKVDKKLSIITIAVNSKSELFCKYFAEMLVKTVSDFYVDTKTMRSVKNVNVLQRQTDSVRRELNAAITGVASSFDTNPNPNPSLQILRAPSQRRQVDVQANQAILTQLVAQLEISKVALRKETPLIQIIDKPILPLEKTVLSKMNWLFIGGVLAVLLTSIFLLCKKLLVDLLR